MDELFARSGHQGVTGTLIDHDAGEQVIVADRARRSKTAVGNRRPLDEGLIGAVVGDPRAADAGRRRHRPALLLERRHEHLPLAAPDAGRRRRPLRSGARARRHRARPLRRGGRDAAADRRRPVGGDAARRPAARAVGAARAEPRRRRRVAQSVAAATTVEQALELAARAAHRAAGFRRVAATLVLEETGEQLHLVEVGPPRPFTPVRIPSVPPDRHRADDAAARADVQRGWPAAGRAGRGRGAVGGRAGGGRGQRRGARPGRRQR